MAKWNRDRDALMARRTYPVKLLVHEVEVGPGRTGGLYTLLPSVPSVCTEVQRWSKCLSATSL